MNAFIQLLAQVAGKLAIGVGEGYPTVKHAQYVLRLVIKDLVAIFVRSQWRQVVVNVVQCRKRLLHRALGLAELVAVVEALGGCVGYNRLHPVLDRNNHPVHTGLQLHPTARLLAQPPELPCQETTQVVP